MKNLLLYILFKKVLEHSGNNYDIITLNIKHSGKLYILLDDSTEFQNLLNASFGMEKKILERSGLFSKFQEPFMTMHFLISRWLVILLEKSYNQINTLFTSTYLPSISPISGSTETK